MVGLQLLQGHPGLPDEFVVAEFVLITHGYSGGQGASQFASKVREGLQAVGGGVWAGPAPWTRLGGVGEPVAGGPHPPQGLSDHVFICDPIVSEGLVPRGVQSVSESFRSELICLERAKRSL